MRLWISGIATVGIAMIVGLIYLGIALRQVDANRKHSDRQNAALLARLQDALETATYSTNKSVCVLRTVATQSIHRLEITKPKGYQAAEKFWANLRDNQVPIPVDLNCATLPKKPPHAAVPATATD